MSRMPAGVLREAVIDVGAIEENVRHLRRLTQSEVIAVVKADGYGHGAVRSARAHPTPYASKRASTSKCTCAGACCSKTKMGKPFANCRAASRCSA